MDYGMRLRELRAKRGLSQKELTDRLNINRSTYARYETSATQPDFDTLKKIADFYGVSTDYILVHTVDEKNIQMIAGEEVDLSKLDSRQLTILKWAWDKKGLSAIESTEDLEEKLERLSIIYDFLENNENSNNGDKE